jgi:peptide-methionine (S)-S-oxide reductase
MGNPESTATLGGGCFWCMEAVFRRIPGVVSVAPGYAGGTRVNPTYEEVCTGNTGHAEVVKIAFDPARIGFAEILGIFFKVHDPTTLNRQGADAGTQYRSIILYEGEAQRKEAEEFVKKAQEDFASPIVTEIKPLREFFPAEDYHRDYFETNPGAAYCRLVIAPKLRKLGLE